MGLGFDCDVVDEKGEAHAGLGKSGGFIIGGEGELVRFARGAEARAAYDCAISLGQNLSEQQNASLRYHRGLISLYMHKLRAGWSDYESRWAAKLVDPPALDRGEPVWRGERLEGTLRVWREQPIGDEVLLSRLVPLAQARAGFTSHRSRVAR